MVIAASPLLVVVRARPAGEPNRLVGEFVKGLLHEFGTGQPVMDPQGLATPLRDRRNARVRLQLRGGVPSGPVGPEGGGQPRRRDVAGARKTGEEAVIGVRGKHLSDAIVKRLDGGHERPQLRRVGLDREAEGLDDRRIGREWTSAGDCRQARRDDVGLATIVRAIELLESCGPRALHGGQRRPLREKVAGLPRREVADPFERLRKVLL